MDIGHRLKAVRTKAALSQRELAKRSGVTNGFISQIEKNQVSPRSPPAQGAGRHSHVAGHLLHR